jgi:hypothetical protein
MDAMMFDDEIITSADLKNDQTRWFERALKSPVSITNRGGRQLVLINREQVHGIILAKEYGAKILKFCYEIQDESGKGHFNSAVFPWAGYLTREDRLTFRDQLITLFDDALGSGNWSHLDSLIDSWKATAESLTNSRFMEVVNTSSDRREYTEVE